MLAGVLTRSGPFLDPPMKILPAALPLALVPTGFGLVCLLPGSGTLAVLGEPTSGAAIGLESTPRELPAPLLQIRAIGSRSALQAKSIGVGEPVRMGQLLSAPAGPSSQAQGLIELVLPVDPLLKSKASPEQFRVWYDCYSTPELVRNHVRLRGLTQFLKFHLAEDLDQLVLEPEARRMLADPEALLAEIKWLAGHLAELRKAPFVGALPVVVGDDAADFERQFRSLGLEQVEIARAEIEHAFRSEKERLVEACFEAGLYTSGFRTRASFG